MYIFRETQEGYYQEVCYENHIIHNFAATGKNLFQSFHTMDVRNLSQKNIYSEKERRTYIQKNLSSKGTLFHRAF